MIQKIVLGTVGLVLMGGVVLVFSGGKEVKEQETAIDTRDTVEVVQVDGLQNQSDPISVYGQVVSANGVQIVPEISGLVKSVSKRLGQTVSPGETVIELQNTNQIQGVLQAQAALNSTEAQLASVKGSQPEDVANLQAAILVEQTNLDNAKNSALVEIRSVFALTQSTVDTTLDQFFIDNTASEFIPQSSSQAGENIATQDYVQLKKDVSFFGESIESLTANNDLESEFSGAIVLLQETSELVQDVRDLVDTVPATQLATTETINRWKSELFAQKQALESKKNTLSLTQAGLSNSKESLEIAKNNLNRKENTTLSSEVIIAESNVASAQAQLNSARISLAKTRITSPIFGTISELDLRVGDSVGPGKAVFIVANDSTLRIDTFVSASQAANIVIGSEVTIDGLIPGRVTSISPALDRQSGKVKVEIILSEQDTRLVEGAGVGVTIGRTQQQKGLLLPIESIFVRNSESYVYVVKEGKAVPTIIETDSLFGDEVLVLGGLASGDQIIRSVRGINDDQEVIIASQDNN